MLNVKNKINISIIDLREILGNNVNCELYLMLLIDYKFRLNIFFCYEKMY